MRHLAHNVRYSLVPINYLLLNTTLSYSLRTTILYKNKLFRPFRDVVTKFRDVVTKFDCGSVY